MPTNDSKGASHTPLICQKCGKDRGAKHGDPMEEGDTLCALCDDEENETCPHGCNQDGWVLCDKAKREGLPPDPNFGCCKPCPDKRHSAAIAKAEGR